MYCKETLLRVQRLIESRGLWYGCFINNGTPSSSYSLIWWLSKYAIGWALVRGTFDWGVLDEKKTHPNTNIERSEWDFGPTSVILCHNCFDGRGLCRDEVCVESKTAECTKKDPCKIRAIGAYVSLLT
jgi:hypothetical protein